ncbi:hypothetical protein Hypma_008046 [Hypsizygus marmoreus]|uniref:Mediator complex subunit 1 n=1 Tax=Hypsizygus marmoreus TaxID=39966 RepID=A0A369JWJ7_HYPMA|nr:hypothetical protein Hypma_008046 [Hypsizygus marmoreus]
MSETLLSTTQPFRRHNVLPANVSHPFVSSAEESCARLQELINTADQLANSLSLYLAIPVSNPKLVSLLRQHSSILHKAHQSDRSIHQITDALRKRSGSSYGEDIPLDRAALVDWCISRVEAWGTSAGMETFKDEGREGGICLVLGGKVLVVDVDFSIDRTDPLKPILQVFSVKTSYANSNGIEGSASNSNGSISLSAFLHESFRNFCVEAQKPEDVRSLEEAARLGKVISEQLQYLVMLDTLAARKEDGGLRWFVDVDALCPALENFARIEAESVASSLSLPRAPLDIFLLRCHTLPLPYLTSPSVSFLVYVSPFTYLSLLKALQGPTEDEKSPLPRLDISISSIRSYLQSKNAEATLATLSLFIQHDAHLFPATMSLPTFAARPTFPLVPQDSELDHIFPHTADLSESMNEVDSSAGHHIWMLDFTNGGKHRGVVMSQSRMRDIELVVNPLGGIDTLNPVDMMSFGIGSWVDLLLTSEASVSPERYTTLYTSPTSLHPPLQLRLTAPEEPGFWLEKVPVHSMKEVWGVLEVVREQCWLNEILASSQWKAEGLTDQTDESPQDSEATEDELQAILTGNLTPRKIPVNVFLPSSNNATDVLFETPDLDSISIPQMQIRRPKIVMTSPERPPMSGLVEIAVAYDETRPRGVVVEILGAMGSDLESNALEEICRRGGTLGLPGRVWSKSYGLM